MNRISIVIALAFIIGAFSQAVSADDIGGGAPDSNQTSSSSNSMWLDWFGLATDESSDD